MDDQTGKNQQQVVADQTQQQTAQQSPVQNQQGQPQVSQPVSGPHKEMAPLSGMSEVVHTPDTTPEIPPVVAETGVEVRTDEERPQLPQEVVNAGVTHAKEHTVHHVEPQGTVQLPTISQAQAKHMEEKSPVSSAARWLAVFLLRQFDKIAYQKLVTKS